MVTVVDESRSEVVASPGCPLMTHTFRGSARLDCPVIGKSLRFCESVNHLCLSCRCTCTRNESNGQTFHIDVIVNIFMTWEGLIEDHTVF